MSENHRYFFLDSSRGLAAFVVLLAHTIKTFAPDFFYSPLNILWDSEAAVLYFFILSGFVLTESIKNIPLSPVSYFNFTVKRILRIYPAFIVILLSAFFLFPLFHGIDSGWLQEYWKKIPVFMDVIMQSLLFIRIPNDPSLRLLPHDWTLSIEILISVALPFLGWLSKRLSWLILILIFAMVKILPIDSFIFDFALGCIIATQKDFLITVWKRINFLGHAFILFLGLSLINLDQILSLSSKHLDFYLIHFKSLGLILLLFALISSIRIQNLFTNKFLTFHGKISYSYYLIHFILIAILFKSAPELNFLPAFFLVFSGTFILSILMYFMIEKPCILVGKKYFSNKKVQ